MHLENRLAAAHVRLVDNNLTIETAGTQERGIKDIGAVGRRDDNDALIRGEAVHLNEQLIERLLTLVVPAAEPCSALTADRIDFVDEHNARCRLLRLFKEVTHA